MMLRTLSLVFLLFASSLPAEEPVVAEDAKREFFENRIRPVLIAQCYECHNSHETAEADLVLDHRKPLLADRDGTTLVVPGHPERSRLLSIIRHEVVGLEMPDGRPKLDDSVIADFATWIRQGAFDPRDEPPSQDELSAATSWEAVFERRKEHWCWQPIQDPAVPGASKLNPDNPLASSNHAIDRFVAAKQREAGFVASDQADAGTLVRRLFFVLTGLPPTPEQAQQWTERLDLDHDQAFAELVDELLDSPRFGERWARHWMDWIRYAESHGSEGDPRIEGAWRYRDYLIRALNADVPFDQLLREHVAGDLLAQPRVNRDLQINESMIGPVHFRMVFHGFAPTDALEEKVRFTDDQVNSFSKAFLGLTVSCARCHDHKFDAISQADYYALYGILAAARPARHTIDLQATQSQTRAEMQTQKIAIRKAVADDWLSDLDGLAKRLSERSKPEPTKSSQRRPLTTILSPLTQTIERVNGGQSFQQAWAKVAQLYAPPSSNSTIDAMESWEFSDPEDAQSWHAAGNGLTTGPAQTGEFAISVDGDRALTGIYPAGIYSHGLSSRDAARLTSPDIQLDQPTSVWLQTIGEGESATRYVVQDYPRNGTVYPVQALSGSWKWQSFDLSYWTGDRIHLEVTTAKDAPLLVKGPERSWFGIRKAVVLPAGQKPVSEIKEALLPLFRNSSSPASLADVLAIYRDAIKGAVAAWQHGTLSDDQAMLLDQCLNSGLLPNRVDELPSAAPLIMQYRQSEKSLSTPQRVPGIEDVPERQQPLYTRGDHKSPDGVVPARFLSGVNNEPYDPQRRRLQLADDMTSDDNPLTRRVIVNRLWHHLFGAGIVTTPDNFGELGTAPSHPLLLDWLASELARQNGSLKSMIRLMVTSETWKRSSVTAADVADADPENRLLTHARVRRLDAEAIRDSMLSVSGKLDQTAFGPSVPGKVPRRSLYVQVIRNRLDPLLRVFDFPEPFATVGRRNATNVPAQSLALLNNEFVAGLADQWARRDATQKDAIQRIQRLFWTAFAREPSQTEIDNVIAFLASADRIQQKVLDELARARSEKQRFHEKRDAILDPVRERLMAELSDSESDLDLRSVPGMIASWDFRVGIEDQIGTADVELLGGATLSGEGLELNVDGQNGAYAITSPMKHDLRAKTLVATVQLADLRQRGGGVMSVQTRNGNVFDAIVFGEQQPAHWLPGSDRFERTKSLRAPAETTADRQAVQVAIVYHADGRIRAFRDGESWGREYPSGGPMTFSKNQWVVTFGLRHLPALPGRMLSGTVQSAMLFDKPLSAEELSRLHRQTSTGVTEAMVRDELGDSQRAAVAELDRSIGELDDQISKLQRQTRRIDDHFAWSELTRSLFLMKEFIYLR